MLTHFIDVLKPEPNSTIVKIFQVSIAVRFAQLRMAKKLLGKKIQLMSEEKNTHEKG